MSRYSAVAMFEPDGTKSLLGHDEEIVTQRWGDYNSADKFLHKGRYRILALVVTLLLLPLTTFLILYLQWHSTIESLDLTSIGNLDRVAAPKPERDLKLLLHPEDHVLRDPGIRYFSWNITKAIKSPNGVQKSVFLINSMMKKLYLAILKEILTITDQFPGPTLEARSGDLLYIEVINFAEEEVSLHWHGLHMRGTSTVMYCFKNNVLTFL
jgi:hypothetical protein